MTIKSFAELKIGDKVLNGNYTKEVTVTDINREKGMILAGGVWRKFTGVRFTEKDTQMPLTQLEPVTEMTFTVRMLKRFSIAEAAILQTIHRAGPKGYIGNNERLCRDAQIINTSSTYNLLISRLCRDGYIHRHNLAGRLSQFTLVSDKVKQYIYHG